MCGIGGMIAARGSRIAARTLGEMSATVKHRGPDDEGFALFGGGSLAPAPYGGADTPEHIFGGEFPYLPKMRLDGAPAAAAGLMHRRLSILDLSAAGHQPMCSQDGNVWVAYNGEIYNYLELRAELEAADVRFRTRSDTEVLLACYDKWGVDCLSRFNGMFAFLLFDRRRRSLFAARDRFGIKPLYYWISPAGDIAFASEIKQFSAVPGWSARMNGQRAYDYLAWSIIDHTDETMFAGVYQLRNGECMQLELDRLPAVASGGRLPVRRWYELCGERFEGTAAEAAGRFQALFRDAVRTHLRSDVPVGSCLSGGLDSSSVVCVMNEQLRAQDAHARQRTFSACSADARFDERRYIEEVVRQTGVVAGYVYPDAAGLFNFLDELAWHQDEPYGSSSIFAQWQVFGLARQAGIKVMLDGQGADEQLGGYEAFQAARFNGLLRSLKLGLLWTEIEGATRLLGRSRWWAMKHLADGVLPPGARQLARRWSGKSTANPAWLDLHALGARPADPYRDDGSGAARSVTELSERQLMRSNLQMLLHWEDRDSMAHSIEARVPFLDHRLVEFVVGLPDEFKLSAGLTKRVLRDALQGVLPERIRARTDKLGFVTPEESWARGEAREQFRAAAHDALAGCGRIFAPPASALIDRLTGPAAPYDFALWRVISFGRWVARHGVVIA